LDDQQGLSKPIFYVSLVLLASSILYTSRLKIAYKRRNTSFTASAQHFNDQQGQFQRFALRALFYLLITAG
jgi:hypothetical protein